jgi:transcriptional regulator EpsA
MRFVSAPAFDSVPVLADPVTSARPAAHAVAPAIADAMAERMLHAIEAAAEVQRRSQFFLLLRQALASLLPHELAVCGAWQRSRRELVFDVFPGVVLPAAVHSAFGQLPAAADSPLPAPASASPLLREVQRQWVMLGGRAMQIELEAMRSGVAEAELEALGAAGLRSLLVHGVTRPQRPAELETLFVFAHTQRRFAGADRTMLDLLGPTLHATYLRMQAQERALGAPAPVAAPPAPTPRGAGITERERQILRWMREGKRNQEIGVLLEISALTVKNHVQKILRKLGAANRAQAVALAMSRNLL